MGKSGGGGLSAAAKQSEAMALELMRAGGKARRLVFGQLTEALKTGNIAARVPIIQSAVEQALQRGSQGVRMTEEALYRAGDTRSPVAAETLATTRALAQRGVAAIPTEVIGSTVSRAPDITQGAAQAAMGVMGSAVGIQGTAQQAAAQREAATLGTAGAAASAIIGIIAAI